METSDVLIIGAGSAGLMAAYKLSQRDKKVTVLEARNRTGGRIHTINNVDFFKHAELGAEFVHGNLPVTLGLLKEANIPVEIAGGRMARFANGNFVESDTFIEGWDQLIGKLDELKDNKSIGEFLDEEFGGDQYKNLRESVTRYVAGYDTADIYKASALALREEWTNEDDDAQQRVHEGYCSMIKYMADECKKSGNHIYLNSVAKRVDWSKGAITVLTADGETYQAKQLIIAMPLGVLQADADEKGAIKFEPPIPAHLDAINKLGFGAIIKFLLEFDESFWLTDAVKSKTGQDMKGVTFLISDQEVPTWWTQLHSHLLTGWLGGPVAEKKKNDTADELLQQALQSLSNIFKLNPDDLKNKLVAWNIANWTVDPFTLGSYAYDTLEAPAARDVLMQPVENTIFFAGEYLYEGPAMGTVEAALTSGVEVAERIG
jgi:monoamine oxidase